MIVEELNDGVDIDGILSEIIDVHRGKVGSIVVHVGVVKAPDLGGPPPNFPGDSWQTLSSEIEGAAAKHMARNGVLELRIYQASGSPKVGEPIIYIVVAAKDRGSAFGVARELLEDVKAIYRKLST